MAFTSRFAGPLRGIVGALFSLYVASILSSFYARALDGAELVLVFFVGLAVMVLASSLISHYVPRRRASKQAPAP